MEKETEKKRKRSEAVGVEQEKGTKKQRSELADVEEEAGGSGRSQPASTKQDPLPDDLILQVFSRLPARSIFRFCAISKYWSSLLTDSFFWLSSRRAPPSDLRIAYAINCVVNHQLSFYNEEPRAGLSHGFASEFLYRYFGSANGLLALQVSRMVSGRFTGCLIVNPATGIESTLVLLRLDSSYSLCGFGYCSSTKKYKILMLQKGSLFVQTIGDNMGTDPRILCSHGIISFDPSVCLDDAVYLLESSGASGDQKKIPHLVSFLLSDDNILKLDLPVEGQALQSGLIEMSGFICVASRGNNNLNVRLWRLKPGRGWEQIFLIAAPTQGRIMGAWNSEAHLLVWFDGWGAMLYHTAGGNGDPHRPSYCLSLEDHFKSTGEDLRFGHSSSSNWGNQKNNFEIVLCWGYKPTLHSPVRFVSICGADHHVLVSFVTGARISGAPRLQFVQALAGLLS